VPGSFPYLHRAVLDTEDQFQNPIFNDSQVWANECINLVDIDCGLRWASVG
jgi:hypothetical protein